MTSRKRPLLRVLLWTIALALPLGLAAMGLLAWLHYQLNIAPFRGERFDAERWHTVWACADDGGAPVCAMQRAACPRGAMVTDLVDHVLAPGRSDREAIRAELGAPSHTGSHRWANQTLPDCDFYPLGMCSGFGVDEELLFICYRPDQTIARAGHYRS